MLHRFEQEVTDVVEALFWMFLNERFPKMGLTGTLSLRLGSQLKQSYFFLITSYVYKITNRFLMEKLEEIFPYFLVEAIRNLIKKKITSPMEPDNDQFFCVLSRFVFQKI